METDWQNNLTTLKDRNQFLLQSEKLSDCRFLVGTSSNQCLFAGHQLLLAMASPVFERMFYGNLPEKNNPIIIPDVEPDAFKAMLDYIYTDEISISSFDHACELYYVTKKYMLPHVAQHCTNFLLSDLSPKNACRAYEFAKLNEESRLIESSMELIATNTREVIADPSFMDIEVSTLMTIFDQNRLNINSELELFNCLVKYANEQGILMNDDDDKDNKIVVGSEILNDIVVEEPEDSNSGRASISAGACGNEPNVADEVVEFDYSASASGNADESTANIINMMDPHRIKMDEAMLLQAVKKIRFLTMTPQQFAEGPARSKLLKQNEAFAILMKISSPTIKDCPMPEGYSQLKKRNIGGSDYNNLKRYYIISPHKFQSQRYYTPDSTSQLIFRVNRNIYLLGVQIKLQELYLYSNMRGEISGFCVCIQNQQGLDFAYTSSLEKKIDSTYELTFNTPFFVYANLDYKIKLINMRNLNLILFSWDHEIIRNGIKFSIPTEHQIGFANTISSILFSI